MNERLVFFCDRGQSACHFYRLGETTGDSSYLYQIYCRSELDQSLTQSSGQRIDKDRLIAQVAAAGGGLVAETQQTGNLVVLRVRTVRAQGYEPASKMLLLAPGTQPKPRPIDDQGIELTAGTLALVPATGDDENNLFALIDQLEHLPGDYRGLVLDVLRQPGIDGAMRRLTLRINELLERLGKRPADGTEASGQGGSMAAETLPTDPGCVKKAAPRARIAEVWHWMFASLLILNLVGVAAGLWLLSHPKPQQMQDPTVMQGQRSQPQSTQDAATAGTDFGLQDEPAYDRSQLERRLSEKNVHLQALQRCLQDLDSCHRQSATSETLDVKESNDPKQAINDLIESWMIQAYAWPTDNPLRIVAMAHFSDGNRQPVYDRDWLSDDEKNAAEPRRQERITFALAKLMLISRGIEVPKRADTLKDPDARTNTKKAITAGLTAQDGGDPKLNDEDRHLLVWLACRVFPQDSAKPGAQIARISNDDPPDSDVDLQLACNDVIAEKVFVAIQRYRDRLIFPTE